MKFAAELEELTPMLSYIRNTATAAGFSPEEVRHIELATEEALVNVIKYAYQAVQSGEIEISCEVVAPHALSIVIVDHGKPFNPLETQKTVNTKASLEDRQVGGLGLYFMRQLMDEVCYERRQNANVLTLTKR